jgi:hypothetical protein
MKEGMAKAEIFSKAMWRYENIQQHREMHG